MREFFEAMRYVRSRTNAVEFMDWFFPNKPFDDYHSNMWELFRDDPIGFWCRVDRTNQMKFESALETLVAEGKS